MFQVPSAINAVRTLVDGGIKLDVTTRELNPVEMATLFKLKGKEGWFLFKENAIEESDIVNLSDVKGKSKGKSPSQRLRGAIYRLWEMTDQRLPSDEYYEKYINTIINSIIDKLN